MLFAVVFVFALSYLPVHMYNIASAFDWLIPDANEEYDMNLIAIRKLLPRVFSYSSSCLNPILYNFMCGKSSISIRLISNFRKVPACICSSDLLSAVCNKHEEEIEHHGSQVVSLWLGKTKAYVYD